MLDWLDLDWLPSIERERTATSAIARHDHCAFAYPDAERDRCHCIPFVASFDVDGDYYEQNIKTGALHRPTSSKPFPGHNIFDFEYGVGRA